MANYTPIFLPDNFHGDWYGWLTNQISHIALGMAGVGALCFLALVVFGEFPGRRATWVLFAGGYMLYEMSVQRWNGVDTVEDWIFVAGYGAGGLLHTLREVNPGTGEFTGNIWDVAPFFIAALAHVVFGVTQRVWQEYKAKSRSPD